jgi:hypothetical protein
MFQLGLGYPENGIFRFLAPKLAALRPFTHNNKLIGSTAIGWRCSTTHQQNKKKEARTADPS